MLYRTVLRVMVSLLGLLLPGTVAAAPEAVELEREFAGTVRPFLAAYCTGCHGQDKPKGQLDLSQYGDSKAVVRDHQQWGTVLEALASKEMPPEKATASPPPSCGPRSSPGWSGCAPTRRSGTRAIPARCCRAG